MSAPMSFLDIAWSALMISSEQRSAKENGDQNKRDPVDRAARQNHGERRGKKHSQKNICDQPRVVVFQKAEQIVIDDRKNTHHKQRGEDKGPIRKAGKNLRKAFQNCVHN
ncbi:MAG: hypothetical protein KH436_03555 [Firmicutes bacterium]|nr:hypothetical protein [Bacillota bacterium]